MTQSGLNSESDENSLFCFLVFFCVAYRFFLPRAGVVPKQTDEGQASTDGHHVALRRPCHHRLPSARRSCFRSLPALSAALPALRYTLADFTRPASFILTAKPPLHVSSAAHDHPVYPIPTPTHGDPLATLLPPAGLSAPPAVADAAHLQCSSPSCVRPHASLSQSRLAEGPLHVWPHVSSRPYLSSLLALLQLLPRPGQPLQFHSTFRRPAQRQQQSKATRVIFPKFRVFPKH